MQQLPKIVRERLQATLRSDHPDADVLTAFAEQLLPDGDRALVMEHLARCGECREVIALALPEMEKAVVPFTSPRPWLSMPALRWGAIAAACMVIAWAGVVRYRQQPSENITAKLEGPKPQISASADGPRDETKISASSNVAADKTARVVINRAGPSAGSLHPQVPSVDALKASPERAGIIGKMESPLPPAPPQSETVEVQGESPVEAGQESALDSDQHPTPDAQQSQALQQSDRQSGEQKVSDERPVVGKAKAPIAPQAAMGSPARNSVAISQAAASVPSAGPRWTITAVGGLQKSYDQGKTWQDVPVSVEAGDSRKQMETKKDKSLIQTSPVLHAISASGLEIWAGGSGGVLYHSLDAGDHWTSTIPSQGGILLTGDIVSVQFSDALHGKIATSTSETWSSGDGGLSWSRQ